MKEHALNYYPLFSCIAGECKHTCCAGWEMNIDQTTLQTYKDEKSKFSQQLNKGINFKKSKFKADKQKRCAFLNNKNLCEIIINLGEKSLCQVCRDHPRFRSFLGNRVELGLGFCCEQACKIILSFKGKIEAVSSPFEDVKQELDFTKKRLLELRKTALDIIQDRNYNIDERIEKLLTLCKADIKEKDFSKIMNKFLSLERINKSWTKRLKNAKKQPLNKIVDNELSLVAEQFFANGIYRHLFDAEDVIFARAILIALVFSWWTINTIIEQEKTLTCYNFDNIVDVVREWSAEVEYSQINLNKLFNFAYKFIRL